MCLFPESYCSKAILYQDNAASPHPYEKKGTASYRPV